MLLNKFGTPSLSNLWQQLLHSAAQATGRKPRRETRRAIRSSRLVETLESRIVLTDFGDAPSPYPTTTAENGPSHTESGPTLGTNRDGEADGMHSSDATTDDTTGSPNDEDGVTFGTIQVGALGATATVNVQNASSGAKLDAWIDFNGDGNWGGWGEQIAASVSVVDGDNTITFDVPSIAQDGQTFARFRLSTAGNLGPEGSASDGEVEDYAVTIAPPAAANGVFGSPNTVTTLLGRVLSLFAVDLDGDGDMDVLSNKLDSGIAGAAWYENDGSQSFSSHPISTGLIGVNSVFAADLDGDGDLDVVCSSGNDKIAWCENDGSQNFTTHIISTAALDPLSVFAADVDGDGDLDVVSASYVDDKIAWFENDGSQNFTAHTINTPDTDGYLDGVDGDANGAKSVFAADVDGDGDLDVLSASQNDNKIAWYENDGDQNFTAHAITTTAQSAYRVFAADVDGDGDLDVLSASGGDNTIAWYENDGNQNFTAHVITTTAQGSRELFVADVDGDGDLDVLGISNGEYGYESMVVWYENDGAQNFTDHTVGTSMDNLSGLFVADVDGDGDLDTLSSAFIEIVWFENLNDNTPPTADIVDVAPDPRTTDAGVVSITFSESVSGVDISDFALTRDGKSVDISGLAVTGRGTSYELDLSTVTVMSGEYELALNKTGSGIVDAANNELSANATDSWTRAAPTVALSVDSSSITEADSAIVTATLSQTTDVDVTIDLGFAGTASSKTDYTSTAAQIVISAGTATGSVAISATQDTLDELSETAILSLGSLTNATAGTPSSVTITITDDDTVPISADVVSGNLVISDTRNSTTDVRVTFDSGSNEFVVTSFTDGIAITVFNFPAASVTGGIQATLGAANDKFDASGVNLPMTVNGGDGNDTLFGGSQNDSLSGGLGNDSIVGAVGNDTLVGNAGADTLDGGSGTADVLSEFTVGNLTLTATTLTSLVSAVTEVDSVSNFEKAVLSAGSQSNRLEATGLSYPVTLLGGNGNDVLIGGLQADSIDGQGGNDTLTGGAGNDSLFGGIGTDVFREVAYTDFVSGQTRTITLDNTSLVVKQVAVTLSADALSGFEVADLSGGTMRDSISATAFTNAGITTINGGGGNDTIVGTEAADVIFTLTGLDSINGGSGSDTVFSGSGNDTISGGEGADNLNGQTGNDSILGNNGNDVLVGGAGIDTMSGGLGNDFLSGQTEAGLLSGGDGNDTLQGNTDKDTLNGDAGDDRLYGLQGDDVINGGDGTDSLVGAIGNDSLSGGAGLDTLQGDLGNDTLDGGADFDRINEVFNTNVTIVGITVTTTSFGSDTVLAIERIQVSGGAANNFFDARLATVPVFLSGGAGNDTLLGGSKGDGVIGGEGDDVLSGGAGADIIDGGANNDFLYEKSDANVTINGSQVVSVGINPSLGTGTETLINIERIALVGGDSANTFNAAASSLPVILLGGKGNDTLIGSNFNDVLVGGHRADLTAGTDSLTGGTGADTFDADTADTATRVTDVSDSVIATVFASPFPLWLDVI